MSLLTTVTREDSVNAHQSDFPCIVSPNAVPRLARRVASLISTVILAAACGGESANVGDTTVAATPQATAKAAPENACALLSATEVSGVIERTVRDSLAMQMDGGASGVTLSQCNYSTPQQPVVASIMLRRSAPGETVAQASKAVRESMTQSGSPMQDVPGLGEVAFSAADQLHVFTSGWYVIVTVSGPSGPPLAKALAQRALARL